MRTATPPHRCATDTAPLSAPPAPPARLPTAAELQLLDEAARQVTSAAASFWKEAGAGDIGDHRSDTLSFDQAKDLGLLQEDKK